MSYPKVTFYLAVTLLVFSLAALAGLGPQMVQARGLPPRDTPTPQPGHEGKHDKAGPHKAGPPARAYIELITPDLPVGVWATVQWQDSSGGWHDVQGWQGVLDNSSRWWVHPKDFGAGPFRWLVTQGAGVPPVGISAPFTLPGGAGQVVRVTAP